MSKKQTDDEKQHQTALKRIDRHRHIRPFVGYYHVATLFDATVSAGGWADKQDWLTVEEMLAAEDRAQKRCYATTLPDGTLGYGPFQCGGCRWFAALGSDWGFCCCSDSPHDGGAVFEHGGCGQHSVYRKVLAETVDEAEG